jgi:predicted PurR-regulated permease PerM
MMFLLSTIFKLSTPLVFAALTAVASFVPMVGASLVWFPLAIFMGLTGEVGKAVLFGVLAAFFVSFTDNFLRPVILGNRLKIHPLLIFFAIVGGLQLFGVNGLILGPLIVIIFFASVELYDQIDQGEKSEKSDQDKGDKPGSREASAR